MNKKLYNEDLANIFKKEVLNESDYDQFSVQPDEDGIERITSSTPEYPEDDDDLSMHQQSVDGARQELVDELANLVETLQTAYKIAKSHNTKISNDVAINLNNLLIKTTDMIAHYGLNDYENEEF